jgi:hypothetical protein
MKTFAKEWYVLVLLLMLGGFSCAAPARTPESLEAGWHSMEPIRGRIVLLVPDDFDGFTHAHSHTGYETRVRLGERATDQLNALLRSAFTSAKVMPVASEAEAYGMISREDPELRRYDFVALPRFSKVTSWDKGSEYGFDVNVALEISSFETGKVEKIGGRGESRTPKRSGASPQDSANLALGYAIDAVKDGIELRRAALSR